MELNKLITENTIELNITAKDKEDLIDKMIDVLVKDGVILDRDKFKEDIYHRESLSNTGIGFGIAIPHSKSTAVKEPRIALGVIKNGVDYDSIDGEPVNLIFMIAVNDSQSDLHLQALANLSRKLMHEEFRNNILNAKSKSEILEII
ncbi:PTS transporter subunit EIIA [Clostridium sp. P21]|uniref:PTS transporter subunit EIIA n=1 Tax=Clostridium muellerianum TaxID=2716538 RepID=A0A7Y0EKU2_9CLOT|nr:fructose PTS transporter subunit IIA [Clostridium muellerianum]NMM64270.1 PTS transporter subunit EIIA [Clostridium muellerianum]